MSLTFAPCKKRQLQKRVGCAGPAKPTAYDQETGGEGRGRAGGRGRGRGRESGEGEEEGLTRNSDECHKSGLRRGGRHEQE